MSYQGIFVEAFPSKFGHGIKLNTDKGEWKLFGKGQQPAFPSGIPVQFDAEKKGNSWAYTNLRPVGAAPGAPMAASQPVYQQPAMQVAPYVLPTQLPPSPTPAGAATPINPDKERDMFITGVVGRAMGSGSFTAMDIGILVLAADEAWTKLQLKRAGKIVPDAPQMAHPPGQTFTPAFDGPDPHDPRFQ